MEGEKIGRSVGVSHTLCLLTPDELWFEDLLTEIEDRVEIWCRLLRVLNNVQKVCFDAWSWKIWIPLRAPLGRLCRAAGILEGPPTTQKAILFDTTLQHQNAILRRKRLKQVGTRNMRATKEIVTLSGKSRSIKRHTGFLGAANTPRPSC